MIGQLKPPAEEIKRLERCINDLVAVLALPATWTGGEPSQIAGTLSDSLLELLRLDLIYLRLRDPAAGAPVEIVRFASTWEPPPHLQETCEVLHLWVGDNPRDWPEAIRKPFRGRDISIVPLQLGLHCEFGVIVAGSQRAVFPDQSEKLILNVAANQAAIGLKEAGLLKEQKRLARDLDQRVVQRTRELSKANEERTNEIAERERKEEKLRLSEEALRDSEQSFRLIVDGIAGLVALMAATGKIETVNRQFLEYFGKTAAELEFWQIMEAVHPDDLPRVFSAWRQSVEASAPYDVDHRLCRADGVYRWFHARGLPLHGTDGRAVRWYVLLTDIHERKEAEEKLRRSEADLLEAQRLTQTCSWKHDLASGRVSFSPEALRMFGVNSDEDTSDAKLWFGRIHRDDRMRTQTLFQKCETEKIAYEADYRVVLPDGSIRHQHSVGRPVLNASGDLIEFMGTAVDVTEQVQAKIALQTAIDEIEKSEDQLRRSEAFLAEGQRLARIGTFSWRVATGEILWSEELYRIFGFDRDVPVTLERIGARVHPEDLTMLNDMVGRARAAAADFEYEHRLLMPDGSLKYVHLIARATRDNEGRLEYIGAAQDVTQRRVSEEALSKARSNLRNVARVTSLGVLTASIAHEVNQPLSGIVTNASTCLRMLSAVPPNVDGALETARRTIRDGIRASNVITRLRTLYTKKDLAPELMDLNEAAREVTSLLINELQRNGVVLRHELDENLPPVNGDRVQLQQVILNLLRNASEAMSGVDDRPRELLIRTERDETNLVRLSVKDAGVGLAPQAADKLFEAFYTTKSDGMGIGLSVSRSIIEAHRGRLWGAANDGPGATFSFSIPCAHIGAAAWHTAGAR